MIYTITLNPAIDHVIEAKDFTLGKTNYYENIYSLIGGKGINVALILNNLECDVLATGFLGAKNFVKFKEKFSESKLKNAFFLFEDWTRTNFKIKNLAQQQETELNGLGPTNISQELVNQLLEYLKTNLKANDLVVASGSLPKGLKDDIYFNIGEIANRKKALFFLDTSKKPMLDGLLARPFLIKPNITEICEILQKPFKDYSFGEIKKMVWELQQRGARNILLSMGSDGSYFFGENNNIYKIGVAKGKLMNSVGAGDSMLAGFVYGVSKQLEIVKKLQYSAASGGATAFDQGLATKVSIEKHLNEITVEKIEGETWK